MEKLRVALLYGGRSGEHEISIRSARSIYATLKERHNVYPVFIDKKGFWWKVSDSEELPVNQSKLTEQVFIYPGCTEPQRHTERAQLRIDLAFPVVNGPHGEDGIIQGALESAGIPY